MVRHDFHPAQGATFFAKCFSACPGSSWEPSSAKCDSATWDDILIMNLSRHEEEDNLDSRRTRSTRLDLWRLIQSWDLLRQKQKVSDFGNLQRVPIKLQQVPIFPHNPLQSSTPQDTEHPDQSLQSPHLGELVWSPTEEKYNHQFKKKNTSKIKQKEMQHFKTNTPKALLGLSLCSDPARIIHVSGCPSRQFVSLHFWVMQGLKFEMWRVASCLCSFVHFVLSFELCVACVAQCCLCARRDLLLVTFLLASLVSLLISKKF